MPTPYELDRARRIAANKALLKGLRIKEVKRQALGGKPSKTVDTDDEDTSLGAWIVLEYVPTSGRSRGTPRRLLVPRFTDYDAMLAHAQGKISALGDVPVHKLALRSRSLPGHEREVVEIGEDAYTKAIAWVENIEVFVLEDDA
ncbi:unnamed protein product [Peniophora sp. CBMAI 1063]|nr:unnamed protein product [Peniophora sp. CBMAI 1063]